MNAKLYGQLKGSLAMLDAENPRAVIGANNPPEELTPFDLSKLEIDDLYSEAKNWLDGEPIETQGQANDIAKLIDALREANKTADERRVSEKKPHDDASKAVQAKWKPIIGNAELAIDTCKKALAPYLQKLEDEKRAAAEKARQEAEAKQAEAQAAMRAAQASTDLAQRETAEALIVEARQADATATRAENAKAQAKGGKRAMSLRTTYRAEIVNENDFAKFVWTHHRVDLSEFLSGLAGRLVSAGARSIPGVNVIEEKVAV